jgi:soluble lytic murein transglycosylase
MKIKFLQTKHLRWLGVAIVSAGLVIGSNHVQSTSLLAQHVNDSQKEASQEQILDSGFKSVSLVPDLSSLLSGKGQDKQQEKADIKNSLDESRPFQGSALYRSFETVIRAELKESRPSAALKYLNGQKSARDLTKVEFDRLRALIAQSYYFEGKLNRALDVSRQALHRSGDQIPLAGWVAGLSAWRLGSYAQAHEYFARSARADYNSPWLQSASAFWASRAALRAGEFKESDKWLSLASTHSRTFYGLIATQALGRQHDVNFATPTLSNKDYQKMKRSVLAQEAVRLSKRGDINQAVAILSRAGFLKDRKSRENTLAFALREKAPALALFLARKTKDEDGRFIDAALYPESPWKPKNGFKIDPALVHAFMRQESQFNPSAVSPNGAKGLMQVMPNTAYHVTQQEDTELKNPNTNVTVGQKYIKELLSLQQVNQDLFSLAIAYNAGPGNLARWKREYRDIDDPLLFIETIPASETRAFVERVLSNYWMYKLRNSRDIASLVSVASGGQAIYMDGKDGFKSFKLAAND